MITIFAIFLLPYAHYHELTLLLVPLFCILRLLEQQQVVDPYYLALLPLSVSWLSALEFAGSGSLKFPMVYVVMFTLGYILIMPGKFSGFFQNHHLSNAD